MLMEATIEGPTGAMRTVKVLLVVGGEEAVLAEFLGKRLGDVLAGYRAVGGDRVHHVRDVTAVAPPPPEGDPK